MIASSTQSAIAHFDQPSFGRYVQFCVTQLRPGVAVASINVEVLGCYETTTPGSGFSGPTTPMTTLPPMLCLNYINPDYLNGYTQPYFGTNYLLVMQQSSLTIYFNSISSLYDIIIATSIQIQFQLLISVDGAMFLPCMDENGQSPVITGGSVTGYS